MANIRLDFDHVPYDGENVVFKAPCAASAVTGICIHYGDTSQTFEVCDAHGDNVGNIDNLFSQDAFVTIILDTDDNKAFVQNADTNAYLEGQLAGKAAASHTHDDRYYTESEINTKLSGKSDTGHTHTVVNGHSVNSDVPANAKFTDTTYSAATTSSAGLMSAADKTKLNGVASGATANTGTVTSVAVKMNGSVKGTVTSSGTIDLGTVITDISGKANVSHTHTKSQITNFGNGVAIQSSAPSDTTVLWVQ